MTTEHEHTPVRKHVKPAHDGAWIPDPAHPGLPLPQEGAVVAWDHYWITRERNEEIVVSELEAPAEHKADIDPVA